MPRHHDTDDDDDWDDEDNLPDGVYHEDEDEDDGEPTVPCPYCRAEVLEGAQYCPRCENYISKEDAPREPRSGFWVVMMVLAVLAAASWALG